MYKPFSLLLVLALLALTASLLSAQTGTQGALLGTVTDATGAIVTNAQVSVTNLGTGLTLQANTDSNGNFEFLGLPLGNYSVAVTAPGFKTWSVARLQINVGDRARVTPVLEVGQVTESVTVEATAELMQTERASIESVVQMTQIRELPLSVRNPVVLVNLVPGMRFIGRGGPERGSTVQGFGLRDNQTQFQMDGVTANAAMDEGGMGIPNVDAVAEFNVQTNSFSAENGRNPLQVLVVTKSGTNEFHGALWHFLQNDALNARNTFAGAVPKLRRNQFGAAIGGPIWQNKTFFFASFEGTPIRGQNVYNSTVASPAMLQGDFSGLPPVRDPLTGQQFPNNRIPTERFSQASKFFFPYVLLPNSPDGRFRAEVANSNDTYEGTGRIDHIINDKQRIYGRWVVLDNAALSPGYSPDIVSNNNTRQHNVAVNYTYTLTPTMLLTASGGYLRSDNRFGWPLAGVDNLTANAGIQGFPTAGREDFVGLPNINVTGWTGISAPWGVPGRLWSNVRNGKVGLNTIRRAHTISFGFEYDDRSVYARHGSHSPRGSFDFNGQYTGNGFADFLLGYTSGSRRNFPLETFGLESSPYTGFWVQDFWKVSQNLTINAGLRLESWHSRRLQNGAGATFDPATGKVIAGVDTDGQMNLNAQPVTPFLAEATQGLWITATEAGVPAGLYEANHNWSPRFGAAWRPFGTEQFVVRGGYGLYYNVFTGNRAASSIVGPPYWAWEAVGFSPSQLQPWETAWPADPRTFIQPSLGEAPSWQIRPTRTHQFNVALQAGLPFRSALTVAYVGSRVRGQATMRPYNEVPPGQYANLQAARPYPLFGPINMLENIGNGWYNALQLKLERRFAQGLSFGVAYSFSRDIADTIPAGEFDAFTPFAPAGYLRGRSAFDRRHILFTNAVWELPFGRGKSYGSDLPMLANLFLGGWQLSLINSFTSGAPLNINVPGATLGNGWNTRANLVGDPSTGDQMVSRWFNTAAFAAPGARTWGNSGIGIVEGPGTHIMDLGLMKNFHFTESKYLQFRAEAFNALNHVNYGNPGTLLGTPDFGVIRGAGAARTIQFGLKFLF
jgi:hypothetical protein